MGVNSWSKSVRCRELEITLKGRQMLQRNVYKINFGCLKDTRNHNSKAI